MKRSHAEDGPPTADEVHPSRKRRMGYSSADAELAKIYEQLADDVQLVRLQAAAKLVQTLTAKSTEQLQRISDALTRLVRGLCSARKAARLGFSVALSEVLRIAFALAATSSDASQFHLATTVERIVGMTHSEGNVSGQEKRDHWLGRRFAFQAVLQSNIAHSGAVDEEQWKAFVDAVAELASMKPWLRSECGAMLYEYLESADGVRLSESRVQALITALHEKGLLKTAEGTALWLSISAHWSDTLLKGVWHKKNPLSSTDRPALKKLLQGSAIEEDEVNKKAKPGTRQSKPSFAWNAILSHAYNQSKASHFERFWVEIVDNSFFADTSSAERKALGLQIVTLAISGAPSALLHLVLSPNVLRCILVQRAEAGRNLFEAAKLPLHQIISRAKTDAPASIELISAMLQVGAFDSLTKTKTMESVLQHVKEDSLESVVTTIAHSVKRPGVEEQAQAENKRRMLGDLLLVCVKAHSIRGAEKEEDGSAQSTGIVSWLGGLLDCLVEHIYLQPEESKTTPPVSDSSRTLLRTRLNAVLGVSLGLSVGQAVAVPSGVVARLLSSQARLLTPLSDRANDALKASAKSLKMIDAKAKSASGPSEAALRAFQLLFTMSMLQVYNLEPDSVEALEDLSSSYEAWKEGGDSVTMLVELLLSLISKPSAIFRKLAEQVFSTFASAMTAESFQSLLDILQQKETLSGQQELFDKHDENPDEDGEGSEDEGIDVDDMSDVELDNGKVLNGEADDDEASENTSVSDAEDGASEDDNNDEEAIFDQKLADALGTKGMDEASDSDGSEMDDDQMMALEPHLTSIFKQRQKTTSTKQESKDAKENIVNFKNRVLDLLAIYVKSQHANVIAMDLIAPLTGLVRTTGSKPTAEKAFAVLKQYFEACNRHKSLPELEDDEACFDLLIGLHDEMKHGGSKLHANACSRSSLFVSKVLVAVDPEHYTRIAELYAALQSAWYLDAKSKVQGSVFTEFTSWSLATRKHKV